MDFSTAVLFSLVALIGANQVVVRIPAVRRIERLFWGLVFADLVAGVGVLVFGLPGYEAFPAVSWVVGLLFVMHIALNLQLHNQWVQNERNEAKEARDAERQRMRDSREEREAAESQSEVTETEPSSDAGKMMS